MAESKLIVMQKKFQKLVKSLNLTSFGKVSSFKLYWLEEFEKEKKPINSLLKYLNFDGDSFLNRFFKTKILSVKQNPHWTKRKFNGNYFYKNGKESRETICQDLGEINASAGSKYERFLEANLFFKSFLEPATKDNKTSKPIWVKSGGEIIPKLSRGFKDSLIGECDGIRSENDSGKSNTLGETRNAEIERFPNALTVIETEATPTAGAIAAASAPSAVSAICAPSATSAIYAASATASANNSTSVRSKDTVNSLSEGEEILSRIDEKSHSLNETRREAKKPEPEVINLPPRPRCRLSCPLPPPEFCPPEEKEIIPQTRIRFERFTTRPRKLFHTEETGNAEGDYYKVKNRNDFSFFRLESDKSSDKSTDKSSDKSTVDPSDWRLQTVSKVKKIYPSRPKNFKSDTPKLKPEVSPKMKALLFTRNNLSLDFKNTIDAPTRIHKDEILVQVTYSGVSGLDLFIMEGKMPCYVDQLILGHEISGKVYAAGSDVNQVKKGENVVVNPYNACFTCRYCTMGIFSCCLNEGLENSIGISKNGGWAEYVVVKKTQVHRVPSELGLDQAALIHPLSCVLSAMYKLNISPGTNVLIQGLGLAGRLWASVFHAQGHRNVLLSDKSNRKRGQFQSLNLGYDFVQSEEVGKYNADVIIECTGSAASIEKCFKILNPNGQLCLFGKPNPTTEIRCTPYEIVRKELKLLGSMGNAFCFTKAVELASTMGYRYLDFDKLGVRVYDLADYREAIQSKKSGDIGKIMFKFES